MFSFQIKFSFNIKIIYTFQKDFYSFIQIFFLGNQEKYINRTCLTETLYLILLNLC